jgi:hypothetical protein
MAIPGRCRLQLQTGLPEVRMPAILLTLLLQCRAVALDQIGRGGRLLRFGLHCLAGVKVIGGTLGVTGGGKDRPLVLTQDFQPRSDISGMILTGFRGDAQVGAQEGRPDLRNQFLHGVTGIAETLAAEVAVEAGGVPRPMRLMPISA